MSNITYIIPLNEFSIDAQRLLPNALKSVEEVVAENDKLIFAGKEEVVKEAAEHAKEWGFQKNYDTCVVEESDFFKIVNKAALACTTKYFSILEFDDQYFSHWIKNAFEYGKNGASILLPINEFVNTEHKFLSFGNEIAWNPSFHESENAELGFIGKSELEGYMDFNVTGAVIKTEDFISLGGLKPSLKIAAWYEFLLRAVQNGYKIYVVPKIGYRHMIGRPGSFMETSSSEISEEEGQWLIKTAQQESFFKEDRNKVFSKTDEA